MFTAYFVEAQWSNQNYVPPLDEYFRTAVVTAGLFAYTASMFLGMGEEIAEKNNAFEWLLSRPRILSATYDIARLKNDMTSHKGCTFVVASFTQYLLYFAGSVVLLCLKFSLEAKKLCIEFLLHNHKDNKVATTAYLSMKYMFKSAEE
ncbi:hypothetical protein Q3G72_027640 [Acer saccharum]|nr:hypothetical protein Q3G72_027640 [Acer saccharum]